MGHNINNLNDDNFLSAYEIICKIMAHYRIKSSEFCSIIGVNPTYVSDAKNKKFSRISKSVADKIQIHYPEINRLFLLTGIGDMFVSGNTNNTAVGNSGNVIQGHNIGARPEDEARYDRLIALLEKEQTERSRLLSIIEKLTTK